MRTFVEMFMGGLIFALYIIKMPFGIERLDAQAEKKGTSRGYEAARLFAVSVVIMWVPVTAVRFFSSFLGDCLRSIGR